MGQFETKKTKFKMQRVKQRVKETFPSRKQFFLSQGMILIIESHKNWGRGYIECQGRTKVQNIRVAELSM